MILLFFIFFSLSCSKTETLEVLVLNRPKRDFTKLQPEKFLGKTVSPLLVFSLNISYLIPVFNIQSSCLWEPWIIIVSWIFLVIQLAGNVYFTSFKRGFKKRYFKQITLIPMKLLLMSKTLTLALCWISPESPRGCMNAFRTLLVNPSGR